MDFASIVVQALVSLVVGSIAGGICLLAFRSRLEAYLFGLANDYLADFASDVAEHPEKYVDMLKPVVGVALRGLTGSGGDAKPQYVKIGPLKIPYDILMPFVEKFAGDFARKAGNKTLEPVYSLLAPEG